MAKVEFCGPEEHAPGREHTLRVFLNGHLVGASQGTPADLEDFGVGYLLSEGWISDRERLVSVEADVAENAVHVSTTEAVPEGLVRRWRTSSASLAAALPARADAGLAAGEAGDMARVPLTFSADDLAAQMRAMEAESPKRNEGECVHCCALGEQDSCSIVLLREDLGRHNAMDKLIGRAWLDGLALQRCALFITGRISAEMAFKALRAQVPVLVSLKSATNEAIALAEREGLTLVSHCRDDAMRVRSHPERIRA